MIVNRFITYIKVCHEKLYDLHYCTGMSIPHLWLDSTWRLIRYGCFIKQYTDGGIYKIIRPRMKDVLTQKKLANIIKKYNDQRDIHLLSNKVHFNFHFRDWVKRKWLYSVEMTEEQFCFLYKSCDYLFLKPIDDQEGNGISVINTMDDAHNIYAQLKNRNLVIEEAIKQHPNMNFNNSSVNTIRIITCMDKQGTPHILRAALRVGVGKSIIDNYTAGGVLYNIDISSGVIVNKGIGHDRKTFIFHPGSNVCMLGFKIPNWEILVESVTKAARIIPSCRFIGWDIAITENGIELIEGNHNPGLFTMESIGKQFAYKDAINYLSSKMS